MYSKFQAARVERHSDSSIQEKACTIRTNSQTTGRSKKQMPRRVASAVEQEVHKLLFNLTVLVMNPRRERAGAGLYSRSTLLNRTEGT
jgi:hypothetical protein